MDQYFGRVIWTNHALQRLSERGIRQPDALATFTHPQSSREGTAKNSYVYYRDYDSTQIEVVATQSEEKKWVILSVWSRPIYKKYNIKNYSPKFLENIVEKVLQKLFGKLRHR